MSDEWGKKVEVRLGGIRKIEVSEIVPNPVRKEGYLRFALPERALVKVDMYDVVGRRVSEVIKRRFDAGTHEIKIDVRNLPAGVYFIRTNINGFIYKRRFIVR